jgi:hypothetical protein
MLFTLLCNLQNNVTIQHHLRHWDPPLDLFYNIGNHSVSTLMSCIVRVFFIYLLESNQTHWLVFNIILFTVPIPVAARSKAWVCGRSLAGIAVRIPPGAVISVSFECCQVEVSASGWSLVQRSPTECGMSECDREASIMRRPWHTRGCCPIGKKKLFTLIYLQHVLPSVSFECCQLEVSASGWSLVQRSPTECGVSECDREASIMRTLWPTRGCRPIGEKIIYIYLSPTCFGFY